MRKTMRTQSVVWLLTGAALLIAAGTTPFHPAQAGPTVEVGRINKAEIISRSEPLLQALLVHATRVETVACPVTTFTSSGQSVHHWNIDCTDVNSGDIAHLLWNADTGELLWASHFREHEYIRDLGVSAPQKEAVGLAWDWFHAMKINGPAEEWRVVGARKKPYTEWDVCLRFGDHYAIMTVKTDTGQLVQVLCGHLPDPTMVWVPFKTVLPS